MAGELTSKYKPQFAEQAKKLCELGATVSDLADFFEVADSAIYRWRITHKKFGEALKIGREKSDDVIERSLYEKASGYKYTDKEVIKLKDGKDKERVEVIEVERVMPPDTTSMIFWLKNRKRDKWADRVVNEHKQEKPFEMKITIEGPKQQAEGALIDVTPTLAIDSEPERAPD